jgi:nucleoid DNA-binding protein
MNKNDLVNSVSQKLRKTKKDTNQIINAFLEEVMDALINGERVVLSNFGTFEKSTTKPIDIYSPYDGKLLKNVHQIRIRFKSSNYFKNKLKDN